MIALSKKDKRFYLIAFFTLLIMIGFGYLPTFAQITPDGMRVLGIFLGCMFAWCFGETVWSSICGLIMLVIYGYGTMAENFISAYANVSVSVMVTSVVFVYAIEKSGLLAEFSSWVIGMKWAQKSPWMMILAFWLAGYIGGALIANFLPPTLLLWAIFYELSKQIGVKPFSAYANIVLCGTGVATCSGCASVPYASLPIIVQGLASQVEAGFKYNSLEYLGYNLFTFICFLIIAFVVLKIFWGKKINQIVIPKTDPYKMNLNIESKISAIVLIIALIFLMIPNVFPSGHPFRVLFGDNLSATGIFMIASVVLMFIHIKEKPVLDITEGLSNVPWPLFLLVGSAMCISNYLTADEMGVVQSIVSALDPLLEGNSAFAVTIIFLALGLICTNFINDAVTLMIMFPIAAQFVSDSGGSVMLLSIIFGQAVIQGCLMPSGSAMGALLHGNAKWLKSKDVFLYIGILELCVIGALLIVAVLGNMLMN